MKKHLFCGSKMFTLSVVLISFVSSCKKSNTGASSPSAPVSAPIITSFSPTQGAAGDTVLIDGSSFTSADSVYFNGVPAVTRVNTSATVITVLVPQGATTGAISVSGAGTTATSSNAFTVNVPAQHAWVAKLASLTATPGSDYAGIRMSYAQNALYITGPAQNTVYKYDLNAQTASTYLTVAGNPSITAAETIGGTSTYMLLAGQDSGFYTYRYQNVTLQSFVNAAFDAGCNSLRYLPTAFQDEFIATSKSNTLYHIANATFSGNSSSANNVTVLSTQLTSAPSAANARVAAGPSSKNIFVFADHALWEYQNSSTLALIAGTAGASGDRDGNGTSALFQDGGYAKGNAIAADSNDNVYVADYGSGCIRKVSKGIVSTIAGSVGQLTATGAYTGQGDKMIFRFGNGDMIMAQDGKSLYVIAGDSLQTGGAKYALYKVTFQ